MLKRAIANGCPREYSDAQPYLVAFEEKNWEMLRWLRGNGFAWDERVCAAACFVERLDILKWARENGCPWNVSAFQAASMKRNEEILVYLRESGCLMEESAQQ